MGKVNFALGQQKLFFWAICFAKRSFLSRSEIHCARETAWRWSRTRCVSAIIPGADDPFRFAVLVTHHAQRGCIK
jgi:hypothetical protein